VHLRFHDGAADFAAVAAPVYHRDPVLYTVELTLLRGEPLPGERAPLLVTVWDGDGLVGAGMRTPPYPLLCSGLPLDAVPAVADALRGAGVTLNGVRGLLCTAEAFAQYWASVSGCAVGIDTEERLYRLDVLQAPTGVPGAARLTDNADTALLIDWQCAFAGEAFGHEPDPALARAALQTADANGDAHLLWTVGGVPVSLAGVRAPAVGVSRVGPVYTPPSQRGHGYGSAATAAACRWAMGAAASDVVLFTDLANPVSNSIYQRIGFEPVTDTVHLSFTG
jgi:GNAT superfamily N-acetyltransferase